MPAALTYSNKKLKRALDRAPNKAIAQAFEVLELEVARLDEITQVHLFSAMSEFLNDLSTEKSDPVNALDVFMLRCQSVLDQKYSTVAHKIGLALAVVGVAVGAALMGMTLGIGIGVLLELWQAPALFFSSLMLYEPMPLLLASASATAGAMAGATYYRFFKTPKIQTVFEACIETTKEHYLNKDREVVQEEALLKNEHIRNEPPQNQLEM